VLIGGFAVIAHGGARTTKDVDLLIDPSPENVAKIRDALQILEDNAVREVADGDVARYSIVRAADEIVIDLLAAACGVDYAEASRDAVTMVFGGVEMPVANPRTLIRTRMVCHSPPTASMSARSFRRPAARLFLRNSDRPRKHSWFDAHLDDPIGVGDVGRLKAGGGEPEGGECREESACVVGGWPNEHVDVAGEARRPVEGQRVGTDDEKLNPVGDQRAEELVEVRRELHRAVSGETRRRPVVPRSGECASTRALAGKPRVRRLS
jgi:hypothetical protein